MIRLVFQCRFVNQSRNVYERIRKDYEHQFNALILLFGQSTNPLLYEQQRDPALASAPWILIERIVNEASLGEHRLLHWSSRCCTSVTFNLSGRWCPCADTSSMCAFAIFKAVECAHHVSIFWLNKYPSVPKWLPNLIFSPILKPFSLLLTELDRK